MYVAVLSLATGRSTLRVVEVTAYLIPLILVALLLVMMALAGEGATLAMALQNTSFDRRYLRVADYHLRQFTGRNVIIHGLLGYMIRIAHRHCVCKKVRKMPPGLAGGARSNEFGSSDGGGLNLQ
eukprot:SAG25_NODE_2188_length_1859_cov_5.601705_2_plen_124_part_01